MMCAKVVARFIIMVCFTVVLTMDVVAANMQHRQLQQEELPGNCQIFFALEYDIQAIDDESMDRFYHDDSILISLTAGSFRGKDAIREFVGFSSASSPFFEYNIRISTNMTFGTYNDPGEVPADDPNSGLCEFLVLSASRIKTAVEYSVNDETAERPAFSKVYFDPTANKVDRVFLSAEPMWERYLFQRLDTVATTSYICDVMLSETCAETAPAAVEGVNLSKEECMERLSALSLAADGLFDIFDVDGNSRGCRMIHSILAATDASHCAHLSFEPQVDVDGAVKCQTNARFRLSDFLAFGDWDYYDDFKDSIGFRLGAQLRVVGRDGFVCPVGKILRDNGKCQNLCRSLDGLKWDKKTKTCVPKCPAGKVIKGIGTSNVCVSSCMSEDGPKFGGIPRDERRKRCVKLCNSRDPLFDEETGTHRQKCVKKCKAKDGVKFDELTESCVPL